MKKKHSISLPRVGFVSLGCPKALVDSERILTHLRAEGYVIAPDYQNADLVVVNTCGFIDAAMVESLDAIGEALAENGKVVVTGCLGARRDVVLDAHPQVLAVTGPHAAQEVMQIIHDHLPPPGDEFTQLVPPHGVKLTPRHYAYLKISEGCNHHCTFCVIPALRGPLVSRSLSEVMQEAENLVVAGVRELLVVAQDTAAYGMDVKYRSGFWQGRPVKTRMVELAQALGTLGVWVRFHYVYPYPSVDEVIPLMRAGHILPYLDIPLQHASPVLLKAMKRPANIDLTLERLQRWREICPDLTLRSTFIVGFPGETEAEFEKLLDFLAAAQLDRVGCFTYSPVAGAAANALTGQVPERVKQARQARLMTLQAEISASKLASKVGKRLTVLVDARDNDGVVGRCAADAPEIDGLVYLQGNTGALQPGDLVEVDVVDSDVHDLWAVVAEGSRGAAGGVCSTAASVTRSNRL